MPWPLSQDYNEAIQNPRQCFSDPELRAGTAVCNALGLPVPCSGNFADVYTVKSGERKWAVKCFTRRIPDLQKRYQEISKYLGQRALPFMVDFHFLENGVKVHGEWISVVKMHWVEGLNLNSFVRDNVDKPAVLQNLCEIWQRLAGRLFEAGMAHCDLQHGNVLLVPGAKAGALAVRLVDYDGIYVPSLKGTMSIEAGHAAYQHPQRLCRGYYGPEIDRFSHLVIYTALRALIVSGKALWEKYDNGDNLLFNQKDFEAPGQAAVFRELAKSQDSEVQMLTMKLAQAAQDPIQEVPLLEELATLPKLGMKAQASASVKLPASRGQAAMKALAPKALYYWAASAGALVLLGIILFFALRGGGVKGNNGPEASEDSPRTTFQAPDLVNPPDAQLTLLAQSQAETEPKMGAETSIGPDPKKEAEPAKDPEPKKEVASEPSAAANEKLLPLPAKDDLANAEKRVKDQFKADFAKRKPSEMLALANKLRTVALDTKDDTAVRFALFNEARMLAAQAGDEQLALRIVDELEREYRITPLAMKCETLEIAAESPGNVAGYKALVGYTIQVMDRALAEDNFETAARLVKVGEIAATKSKSPSQTASVQARAKEVDALRKEYGKTRSAAEVLAKDPQDPDANLAMGRYLCFAKLDWRKGLPLLARGGDESLARAANDDLSLPDDAAAQADLGDRWWKIAHQSEGFAKTRAEERARYWYRQCFNRLAGLRKKEIEERLKLVVGNLELRPGLLNELFDGEYHERWVKSRIDPNINFDWGAGSPDKDIPADHFSCRWQGWLLAPKPGIYTLVTTSDDGSRVILDGTILIDKLDASRPAGRQTVEVQLTAKPHHLEVHHNEGTGTASMVLSWIQHDGFAEQLVPPEALFHDQDQEELASDEPYRKFKGKWTIRYANRAVREYAIDARGMVTFVEGNKRYEGRLQRRLQDTIVNVGDGKLERIRLDKGKLLIEHFNPAADYPVKVNVVGVGTKKE